QILEFCNYKLGKLPHSEMPWEFAAKARSTILPWIVYLLIKTLGLINVQSPFIIMFLVRLLTGIVAWFISCRMCLLLMPQMKTEKGEMLLVLMSMFLWFVPFLNVRFSAENISGLAFLYGTYFILKEQYKDSQKIIPWIIAGFFIGLSCFIRIQLVFALIGFAAWLLIIKKIRLKYLFTLLLGAIFSAGINYLLDSLFYGTSVFTPFNYFCANIIQHKAESFGVEPWWFFIAAGFEKMAPPLSIFLLFMFAVAIYKYPKHPLIWAALPFILFHFFIGHKEWRFLFPVAIIFIYICALGLDYMLQNKSYLKIHKYVYIVSVIVVIPILVYRTFFPAEPTINYSKYLYYNSKGNPSTLFILNNASDYTMLGNNASFYKSPTMVSVSVSKFEEITNYLALHKVDTAYYLDKNNPPFTYNVPGYKKTKVYCIYPDWLLNHDINNWKERASLWIVYQLS